MGQKIAEGQRKGGMAVLSSHVAAHQLGLFGFMAGPSTAWPPIWTVENALA